MANDSGGTSFATIAGGVFVGGLLLVLAVTFWPIALGLAVVLAFVFAMIGFETFRNIVLGVLLLGAFCGLCWWASSAMHAASTQP